MKPAVIKFRDKRDIRPLPPIPDGLVTGMQELIDTKINVNGAATLFDRLEAIYAYLDRYNAFVASFAVCQKGCNHCCRIGVSVSRLEAEYITVNGGPTLNQGGTMTLGRESVCPFLAKDGGCSIYATRPFNCRTFHTLDDPKYCVSGNEDHQTYGSAGMGYGVTIYAELARWLKGIHESNGQPYRDIRDWFPTGRQPSLIERFLRKAGHS